MLLATSPSQTLAASIQQRSWRGRRAPAQALLLGTLALLGLGATAPLARADGGDAGKGPWRVVRSENGIMVLDRTVPGTKLREFQGTGVIEASIATILAVLQDTAHNPEWMKEAMTQVAIATEGNSEIFYNRTKSPWPVADRDVVMRATVGFDLAAKMMRIDFESTTHPQWPPVPKVVRMPFLRGHWHLWPLNDGKWTRAEYQVHADPGGSLPNWVVNLASKQIPYGTIAALQKQVRRRRYPEFEAKLMATPEYQAILQPPAASSAANIPATSGPLVPVPLTKDAPELRDSRPQPGYQ